MPLSFEKTLEILKTSKFVREAIGDDMVEYFIKKLTKLTEKKEHEHWFFLRSKIIKNN